MTDYRELERVLDEDLAGRRRDAFAARIERLWEEVRTGYWVYDTGGQWVACVLEGFRWWLYPAEMQYHQQSRIGPFRTSYAARKWWLRFRNRPSHQLRRCSPIPYGHRARG